ncbi:PREDICTED: uncharacterized protein LOC108772559 isoform X1 [Cyphomyrmex costatus]|uniref:Uncharacterized protein n=1 Tax=Cyphomyrmex costatus TaxID=456900 RepID=A0A195CV66_9HYME|nr:PREDICTED: uncharacterized protein LOC108772559 isoform X1 [Cyphomyrmex costatus]XP_018393615.1 PREDICTED: uncharacterized protein LOC108772559 isoform X1 [Cyphomyrmex costatus]KYN04422.1 hypothetical protein ALC62_04646 [Cyphomyrmex costatus]
MPDSEAVYQPTTVGFTYDSGGDDAAVRAAAAAAVAELRYDFWRMVIRHKRDSWKMFKIGIILCSLIFFVIGLAYTIINLINLISLEEDTLKSSDDALAIMPEEHSTMTPDVQQQKVITRNNLALGAGIMATGVLLTFTWVCATFIYRKLPMNAMSTGQMLGGLNPSTDLLVGSTSQYGPVLTEAPSQLKTKQANQPAVPLSDQEEEMHTLMQDSANPPSISVGSNTITNKIPG